MGCNPTLAKGAICLCLPHPRRTVGKAMGGRTNQTVLLGNRFPASPPLLAPLIFVTDTPPLCHLVMIAHQLNQTDAGRAKNSSRGMPPDPMTSTLARG